METFVFSHSLTGLNTAVTGQFVVDSFIFRAFKTTPYTIRYAQFSRPLGTDNAAAPLYPKIEGGVAISLAANIPICPGLTPEIPGAGTIIQGLAISVGEYQPWEGCIKLAPTNSVRIAFNYWNVPLAANVTVISTLTIGIE